MKWNEPTFYNLLREKFGMVDSSLDHRLDLRLSWLCRALANVEENMREALSDDAPDDVYENYRHCRRILKRTIIRLSKLYRI